MPSFILLNNKQMLIVYTVPLFPKSPQFPALIVMNTMTVSPVLLPIFNNRIRPQMLFLLLLKKLLMHYTIYHTTKLQVKMVFIMKSCSFTPPGRSYPVTTCQSYLGNWSVTKFFPSIPRFTFS